MLTDLLIDTRIISMHGLMVFVGLATYVIGSRTRHQRRHPSAALAWVIGLTLAPEVTLPLYVLFGNRKLPRRELHARALPSAQEGMAAGTQTVRNPARRLADALQLPPASSYHELVIHEDGQRALDGLHALVSQARHTLDLCTFLVGNDALGDALADWLVERARAGVRVRLLVDGVGIYLGGRFDLRRMRAHGVQVALFVSPFRSMLPGRTNLRNHRKLVVADGSRAWAGGRNLAAEYFVGDTTSLRHKTAWVDLSFEFSGALARQAQQRFALDWGFATGAPPGRAPGPESVPDSGFARHLDGVRGQFGAATPVEGPDPARPGPVATSTGPDTPLAQLVATGPDQFDDTVHVLLVSGCFSAQRRILAVTPYFVPDPVLLMALTLAARRGLDVDLLLPAHSNHRLADWARHASLRELTAAGGRVWLAPRMVHAKAIVIDDTLALAGSANLDERSLFLNYELMVAFYDPAPVAAFAGWIERRRVGAERYRGGRPGLLREIVEGMVRWLAFQL